MISPVDFDLVKKTIFFPLNDSYSSKNVDYDAHIRKKLKYSINQKFKSMTNQELNTLRRICGLEGTQFVTLLAMSLQNLELTDYLKLKTAVNLSI